MKLLSILALAAAALAAVTPNKAAPDAADVNNAAGVSKMADQAQSAAGAGGAQQQGWHPHPPPPPYCQPGMYSCTWDRSGWRVCDVSGTWVYGGACPAGTSCDFNYQNGSPYCVPPPYW